MCDGRAPASSFTSSVHRSALVIGSIGSGKEAVTRSGGATAQPRLTYDRRIRRSQGARAQIAAMAPFLLSLQRFWIPAIHIYSPLITPRSTCLAGFLRDSSHAAEARPRDRLFADIGSIWSHILRDLQVPSFTGLHRYRTGFPDERRVGRLIQLRG